VKLNILSLYAFYVQKFSLLRPIYGSGSIIPLTLHLFILVDLFKLPDQHPSSYSCSKMSYMTSPLASTMTVPYYVVESLHRIIIRQQAEAHALVAENNRLKLLEEDDHSVRQFARSQPDEYRGFLCGVMSEEDVAWEIHRLGEFDDDDDDLSDEYGSDEDDLSDYSEEEAEMSE
jgi:hypothetical protein